MKRLLLLAFLLCAAPLHAQENPLHFSGLARACAGGVADETHTIRLNVELRDGAPRKVQFSLNENAAARFVTKNGELAATQTLAMTPQKSAVLRIRSGARAETPFLLATGNGKEIGRVQLDFGLPDLYRRFSDNTDELSPHEDTGVLSRDDWSKYYLKFKKDLSRGDVSGNWAPVSGHRLRVYPYEVDARVATSELIHDPAKLSKYIRVVNPNQPNAKECILTTRADGSVLFRTETTSLDADEYIITADDLTAPDDENYLSVGEPATQTLREYSQVEKPQWLALPDDLSLRVMWREQEKTSTPANVLSWRDARSGMWNAIQPLTVAGSDTGVNGWKFAPDANLVLFSLVRPGQYLDLNHDLALSDLRSGTTRRLRDYLFGDSEVFSRDGKKIVFVAGSQDTLGSGRIGDILSLRVMDLATKKETTLLTDDSLNRDTLAWTRNGDLLAGTFIESGRHYRSSVAFSADGKKLTLPVMLPVVLRFKNATHKKTIWQTRASSPLPSPDGKHIAFIGTERAPDGNWRDTSPAINIARDDGTHRRTLTRISDGAPQMFWSPDGKTLYLWSFFTSANQHGIASSPVYNAKKPQLKPIPIELTLSAYNVESGKRRTIADLKANYAPGYDDDFPQLLWHFKALGVTSNGKYLLFHRVERRNEERTNTLPLAADSLHAIRLSDGKLITLAVLDRSLDAAPR